MARMRVLSEADLRRCIALDASVVDCIWGAFRALATQAVAMPPILRLDIPERRGEVDVKTAYVAGLASFALKVSPGFFDNPQLGLLSLNGLMILFSARTGLVEALLLDNGYLTDLRTAAAGVVAANHLARPDATRVAIFGAGVQARLQLEALRLVRPIRDAVIWARDLAKAAATAADLTRQLGLEVVPEADPRVACRQADIVVTTTPAERPILEANWIRPGQHVTAMGSDAEGKNEVAPALLMRATYVADRLAQTRRLGELHHAIAANMVAADRDFAELGQVVAGQRPGRQDADEITLCDLTGTGVQDTAIATLAHDRAAAAALGQDFKS